MDREAEARIISNRASRKLGDLAAEVAPLLCVRARSNDMEAVPPQSPLVRLHSKRLHARTT